MEISKELIRTMSILMIAVTVLGFVNYIVTSLTLYKLAKAEKMDKPWLAWIPIGNYYILIKLGSGIIYFLIPLVIAMYTVGWFRVIFMAIFVLYTIYMYHNICKRYGENFILIGIGALALLVGMFPMLIGFAVPMYLIGFYGQWRLFKKASKIDSTKN